MPLAPFLGVVPLGCFVSDCFELLSVHFLLLFGHILAMVLNVLSTQQQSQVADCVIAVIAINVMNMIAFGNWATLHEPHIAVEGDFLPFAVNFNPALKVFPIALTFCIRVAMELVAVVRCSLSLHNSPF